jgi:hypothetical protein
MHIISPLPTTLQVAQSTHQCLCDILCHRHIFLMLYLYFRLDSNTLQCLVTQGLGLRGKEEERTGKISLKDAR